MKLPGEVEASAADHLLAAEIATAAGEALVSLRRKLGHGDPGALRREGDRQSHDLILDRLRRFRPRDPVLSEEGADDLARLRHERVWIVDPLDGTREFGESGRSDWAVHVALVVAGVPLAAAVCLPARGLNLTTAHPFAPAERSGRLRLLVSRSRAPKMVMDLARDLDAELIEMGSAGAKTAAVILGEGDAYVHAGGQFEWDSAAPAGVARAAGLHVSRIDGSPLRYNQPSPVLPDLLVCRPQNAATILGSLRRLSREESGRLPHVPGAPDR